jgi:hypothetical protein
MTPEQSRGMINLINKIICCNKCKKSHYVGNGYFCCDRTHELVKNDDFCSMGVRREENEEAGG